MRTIQMKAPAIIQISPVANSFFFICSNAMRNIKAPNRNYERGKNLFLPVYDPIADITITVRATMMRSIRSIL